jgi:hypothetical protein
MEIAASIRAELAEAGHVLGEAEAAMLLADLTTESRSLQHNDMATVRRRVTRRTVLRLSRKDSLHRRRSLAKAKEEQEQKEREQKEQEEKEEAE